MRFKLVAAVAFAALAGSAFSAAPNETLHGSATLTYGYRVNCNTMACLAKQKSTLRIVHAFTISADQSAAMVAGRFIKIETSLGDVSFTLSEDPEFQDGDKSATLIKPVDFDFNIDQVFVKLEWTEARMRMTLLASEANAEVTPPDILLPSPGNPGKDLEQKASAETVTVSVATDSQPINVNALINVPVNFKQGNFANINQNGSGWNNGFFSLNSMNAPQ